MIGLSVILGHRQAARLDSARLGSALLPKVLPKVGVWCRRDIIFPKKLAFGVDETTFDFQNVYSEVSAAPPMLFQPIGLRLGWLYIDNPALPIGPIFFYGRPQCSSQHF